MRIVRWLRSSVPCELCAAWGRTRTVVLVAVQRRAQVVDQLGSASHGSAAAAQDTRRCVAINSVSTVPPFRASPEDHLTDAAIAG